ncbi:MAG: hypothetical protein A3C84_05125 [Candidatus Ryanbacteria bacterium RIFCSPHIGHO2_02_FULL_48_12]|uniref:DoxX family protein n=1 Tax=Candidatus Ryanbacteria bacterium RIFCSPHIGHO2_01_FULL_48_27 TaxID=1802115 RepID=A0A1G2G7H4_9BACT|nr:MAG: hypothetical protein A2756_06000 [Candidatus Ryanbacteria bacterium RIFCSPHIGHO2_01_FULL_48_27]OGZ49543.1 MAG: hypothetical protein A3C84_05125 [Candidatus Ryanbacteria bacterium RIFCSPHIGHO2_02_FULL_48_12]
MGIFARVRVELPLRFGLGAMFLYSGYDLVMHPTGWYWAVRPLPQAVQAFINANIGLDRYLMLQGAGELVLAFLLIAWFLPRWTLVLASFLTVLEMAVILFFVGVSLDTFRDIGLLGGALSLWLISLKHN